jgi:NMD protein affecting ribosome stability and mRNA decay
MSFVVYSSKDLIISIDIIVEGILKDNKAIKHQQNIKINLAYDLCKNCMNIRGGIYFLSIIQLRVKDESYFSIINDALNDIHNYVEKLFEKDARHYITKLEDQKYGVDLYLSTNELMNYIVKLLNANYRFIIKRSKKLVGRDSQKGRNLYRLKTLIKFLPVNKNDKIFIEDREYYIENITKTKVIMRNNEGPKLIKDYSYFFNDKIIIKKS